MNDKIGKKQRTDNIAKERLVNSGVADICDCQLVIETFENCCSVEHIGTHCHGLEESLIRKIPNITKNTLLTHVKHYPASLVRSHFTENYKSLPGVEFVTLDHANNYRKKVLGPNQVDKCSFEEDLNKTVETLKKMGYFTDLSIDEVTLDFVLAFSKLEQLQCLSASILVLMDSTHDINKYKFKLTTLYTRNNYGVWLPGAQFFIKTENSQMVTRGNFLVFTAYIYCLIGLNIIRKFVKEAGLQWYPMYFVIDQSATEAKSIRDCFRGILEGEVEIKIFYCRVHLIRTLTRRIKSKAVRTIMIKAMDKVSKLGCEQALKEAMSAADESTKKYINLQWARNTEHWGMYSRQHSPLLLQNTTTNALESYHNVIKKKICKTDTFLNNITKLDAVLQEKLTETKVNRQNFKTKNLSECKDYPVLKKFRLPFQVHIA